MVLMCLFASSISTLATAQDKKAAADPAKRQVFFGEQHLHTTTSVDAYIQGNHKNTIEDAFNYNKATIQEQAWSSPIWYTPDPSGVKKN